MLHGKDGCAVRRRLARVVGAASLLVVIGPVPALRAQVVLNEVLADPNRDWDGNGSLSSRDDEWVEIVNAGAAPVSLAGYRIAGADTVWRYEFSGTLAPGEVRVVYGSGSYAWEQATGNPLFGLRLSNTGGTVLLWRLAGPDTTLVDSYTYKDHEAEDDRSSGRVPDGGPEWRLFDAMNPYTGGVVPKGSGCSPSPGAPFACPTPVTPGTWGKMKRIFRAEE